MEKQFYHRNLLHWQFPDATYFVTYRLFGSIPQSVIEQLKAEYQAAVGRVSTPELRSGVCPHKIPRNGVPGYTHVPLLL